MEEWELFEDVAVVVVEVVEELEQVEVVAKSVEPVVVEVEATDLVGYLASVGEQAGEIVGIVVAAAVVEVEVVKKVAQVAEIAGVVVAAAVGYSPKPFLEAI